MHASKWMLPIVMLVIFVVLSFISAWGSDVVCSQDIGNARASAGGMDNDDIHAFLCLIPLRLTREIKKIMNNRLILDLHHEIYVIHCDNVLYMQADGLYTTIIYVSGIRFVVPIELSDLEKRIFPVPGNDRFLVKAGQKYIINLRHVFHVNIKSQTMSLADCRGNSYFLSLSKTILRDIIARQSEI